MKYFYVIVVFFFSVSAEAQDCSTAMHASAPQNRFIVQGDEVLDIATGLVWSRCLLGQSGATCHDGVANILNWKDALNAVKAVRDSTGVDWRLPNIKEMQSIVEQKCFSPAVNLAVFPNTLFDRLHWTSTSRASYKSYAWALDFDSGIHNLIYKSGSTSLFYVRMVRDR